MKRKENMTCHVSTTCFGEETISLIRWTSATCACVRVRFSKTDLEIQLLLLFFFYRRYAGITKEWVAPKPRTTGDADTKEAPSKSIVDLYEGSKELLAAVEKILAEGGNKSAVYRACRQQKLGSNREVLDALRVAEYKRRQRSPASQTAVTESKS
jgi:hypothetical protein